MLYEIDARGHHGPASCSKSCAWTAARMLTRFADAGLTAVCSSLTDRRSNHVALTTDGDIIVERLNRKSDEAVAALLGPLDVDRRARLTAAMRIIRTILGDIEPAPGDPPPAPAGRDRLAHPPAGAALQPAIRLERRVRGADRRHIQRVRAIAR